MYLVAVIVLALVAAVMLFLGFQKRNDPAEQQKATTFIIIGLLAVLLLILIQFGVIPL